MDDNASHTDFWARSSNPALARFSFNPNPGSLAAKVFVPADLPPNAALVVVLHGCSQTPEAYDRGTGWSDLAERHGFAVLYPEQRRTNNMNGCFNWFKPGDMRRGAGEPASIKSMIDQMCTDHAFDPSRIFMTGLSAGAAMAGVMLAAYPELFAGGGLIAGVPYGVARSMPAAMSRMRRRGRETDRELAGLVRKASRHDGPWPAISIWHGSADSTVDASNGLATVAQWRAVHGLSDVEAAEEHLDGHSHRVWRDASGRTCVEEYVITGMGHGTPLDAGNPENVETAGAYLIDAGVSSTQRLAQSWGLTEGLAKTAAARDSRTGARPAPAADPDPPAAFVSGRPALQKVIENALRSAGLM